MAAQPKANKGGNVFKEDDKGRDVRLNNIIAARAVADAIRTSLGPRGMDKMIQGSQRDVIITNDGATILRKMELTHPAAKMLVDISKAQDIEVGDGTTTVVVLAGAFLRAALQLLERGIHPAVVSDAFQKALTYAINILDEMSVPVTLDDRESLLRAANTSLNSKVVSQYSSILSPIAVDAVLRVIPDLQTATNVDLNLIRVVKKLGQTIDDTELVDGLVFTQKASKSAGGPTSVKNAKIGLIQFQLSAPKTDIEHSVVVSEYSQMDRILREERRYLLDMVKKIKATQCNVLLIQKSILRDAVNDLSLHYLAKAKIMVIRDIEREEIEFISKTLGCLPIASIDGFVAEKLGHADNVIEETTSAGAVIKVTGIQQETSTCSILCRGSNLLMIDEAERSLHDALCVVRSLVKKRAMLPGGGAPEIEMAVRLAQFSKTLKGPEAICVRQYADALEVIPSTLAENLGLSPIGIVTELRNRHISDDATHRSLGINVKKGMVTDMVEEQVVQPELVTLSAMELATECVRMMLKIDDMVIVR